MSAHEDAFRMCIATDRVNTKMLEGAADEILRVAGGIMQERTEAEKFQKMQKAMQDTEAKKQQKNKPTEAPNPQESDAGDQE